jgi:hypothetical protein
MGHCREKAATSAAPAHCAAAQPCSASSSAKCLAKHQVSRLISLGNAVHQWFTRVSPAYHRKKKSKKIWPLIGVI